MAITCVHSVWKMSIAEFHGEDRRKKQTKNSDLLGISRWGGKKREKIRSEFFVHVYLIIIRAVTGIITAVYLLLR